MISLSFLVNQLSQQLKDKILNCEGVYYCNWITLFIEGLFLAIFPSRIKNILEMIKNIPEHKLRLLGIVFFDYRFFNYLVY